MGYVTHLVDVPHFVYRAYDADGELLYVGLTHNVRQRFQAHRSQARWYQRVASVRLVGPFVGCDARRRARALETRLIRTERPLFNADPSATAKANAAVYRGRIKKLHAEGLNCEQAHCAVCGGVFGRYRRTGS